MGEQRGVSSLCFSDIMLPNQHGCLSLPRDGKLAGGKERGGHVFRRVLVPLEGAATDIAREAHALDVAQRLAEHEGARLVLLHVDRPHTTSTQLTTHVAIINRAAELRRTGVPVSVHFASGAPDENIARTAREEHADLIILAPQQRPLLRTLLQPGVTGRLMRHAPAPLLIVPERISDGHGTDGDTTLDALLEGGTASPVIVPLDGSPEAERALPLAIAFALTHHRALLLVTVAAPQPFVGIEMSYPGVVFPAGAELPEDRLREGLRYLGTVRRTLRTDHPDLAVQIAGRIGEVAPVVAEFAVAHPGSIVIMTTHGHGRALRLLLGSVATELLSLTPVPLLIVPSLPRSLRHGRLAHTRVEAVRAIGADEGGLETALDSLEPRSTI